MEELRKLIDAVAFLVASMMSLRPVSWEEAKTESVKMRKLADTPQPTAELYSGVSTEQIKIEKAQSPIGFLFDSIFNAAAAALCIYLAWQIATALFWSFILAAAAIAVSYLVMKAAGWWFDDHAVASPL